MCKVMEDMGNEESKRTKVIDIESVMGIIWRDR